MDVDSGIARKRRLATQVVLCGNAMRSIRGDRCRVVAAENQSAAGYARVVVVYAK